MYDTGLKDQLPKFVSKSPLKISVIASVGLIGFLNSSFIFQYPWVAHDLYFKCPLKRREKRLRDERDESVFTLH